MKRNRIAFAQAILIHLALAAALWPRINRSASRAPKEGQIRVSVWGGKSRTRLADARGFTAIRRSTDKAVSGAVEIAPIADDGYLAILRSKIAAVLRYPFSLQRRGVQGTVLLDLVFQDGQVRSSQIAKSSGSSELDELALDAVRSAQPFPKPAPETKMGRLEVNLPVEFKISDSRS